MGKSPASADSDNPVCWPEHPLRGAGPGRALGLRLALVVGRGIMPLEGETYNLLRLKAVRGLSPPTARRRKKPSIIFNRKSCTMLCQKKEKIRISKLQEGELSNSCRSEEPLVQIYVEMGGKKNLLVYLPEDSKAEVLYRQVLNLLDPFLEIPHMRRLGLICEGRVIKKNCATLADLGLISGCLVQSSVALLAGMPSHGQSNDELRIEINEIVESIENRNEGHDNKNPQLASVLPRSDLDVSRSELEEIRTLKGELFESKRNLQTANTLLDTASEAARAGQAEIERLQAELARVDAASKAQIQNTTEAFRASQKEVDRLRAEMVKVVPLSQFESAQATLRAAQKEIQTLKQQVESIYSQTVSAIKATVTAEVRAEVAARQQAPEAPRRPKSASALATATAVAANQQSMVDGRVLEYLSKLVGLMERSREQEESSAEHLELTAHQVKAFHQLEAVMAARLRPDEGLKTSPAADGEHQSVTVLFDGRVDDDEVLLQLFHEIDLDGSGLISLEELLNSPVLKKKENQEMAGVLIEALECDFDMFRGALRWLSEDDFGEHKKESKAASIAAIFDLIVPPPSAPAQPGSAGDGELARRAATRADLKRVAEEFRGQGRVRLAKALEGLAEGELDFLAVKSAVRRLPRVSGQRMEWVRSLGLDAALARHLAPGTLDDGLYGLKNRMSDKDASLALDAFIQDTRALFQAALKRLREVHGSTSAVEANSKFEGFTGNFATLEDFYAGAEETMNLGYPNPDLEKGIMMEHIAHPSVRRIFVTPNYQIATCLLLEYWWAVDPEFAIIPRDPAVRAYYTSARKMLKDLRQARGNGGEGPDTSDALIFPGEVGDTFFETLVIFSVRPWGSMKGVELVQLTEKLLKADTTILESEEERARGARAVAQRTCLRWLEQNKRMFSTVPDSDLDRLVGELRSVGTELVGVVLPMTQSRAEEKTQSFKEALADAASQAQNAIVTVGIEACRCKTFEFCTHTSVTVLQKRLEEISLSELKRLARDDFGIAEVVEKSLKRDVLAAVIINSFVHQHLRSNFESSLHSASNSGLKAILKEWGVHFEQDAEQDKLMSLTAAALDSEARWAQVAAWVALFHGRIQGRTKLSVRQMMQEKAETVKAYKMQQGEVLAAYLYTGPNFVPYNCIYRSFPPHIVELLRGDANTPRNTMSTTLFCISSALIKLGRNTQLPENRKVYRGLGSMLLPQHFWVEHGKPAWKGGVERAIMSTTSDKAVALFYSGGKGMVVEISVGRIQIGGDVGWLSMVRKSLSALVSSMLLCLINITLHLKVDNLGALT